MFYLLHGDDEFTSREQLKTLRQKDTFGYNLDTYNGAEVDLKKIILTINTLPFLSEQRLGVIDGMLKKKRSSETAATAKGDTAADKRSKTKKSKKSSRAGPLTRAGFEKELAEYIATMQETPVLAVLVEEALEASNPLVKVAEQYGKVIYNTLPKGAALENWITKRTKNLGVSIA